jgi:hypothetical protein
LDEFVAKEVNCWFYRDMLKREIELDDLTFESFVLSLQKPAILNCDEHWQPQSTFLLYKEYSDYFALGEFNYAIIQLNNKIGLDVVDARQLTDHGIDEYELLTDKDFSQVAAFDIALLKRQSKCLSPASLYTPQLVEIVKKVYA